MTWGGLNPALTAWRDAYNRRLPGRGTASDGARADALHGSKSQHQEDADGTVDANDMDVNVLGSSNPTGTVDERNIIEAMKLDFEQDPHGRGHLWIHQREIANRDIGPWSERHYGGANPHDKHVHWESRQAREGDGREWPMPHTDALLRRMRGEDIDMSAEFFESVDRALTGASNATAQDRLNRDRFARAVRFSLGLEVDDQKTAALPCGPEGLLEKIKGRLPEGPAAAR